MEEWNHWIGKKVYIILKNNRKYSGVVNEIHDAGNGLIFISIIDKFGEWVTFSISELTSIEEEK